MCVCTQRKFEKKKYKLKEKDEKKGLLLIANKSERILYRCSLQHSFVDLKCLSKKINK